MSRHLPLARTGLPVLRRGRGTVQLGVHPQTAVVVDRLSDDAATALLHLDGTTGRHDLLALAPELGTVLDDLHRLGLLDDDPGPSATLSRVRRGRQRGDLAALAIAHRSSPEAVAVLAQRARSTVVVRGSDPTAAHVAVGLAANGVGTVSLEGPDHPVTVDDLTPVGPWETGGSWREAVSEALRRQGASPAASGRRTARPALVVLCSAAGSDLPWTDPELADDLLADGVAHLAVATSGAAARVGPLVVPGRTSCLWCLDRRSTDRDPAWPGVADQLRLRHPQAQARSTVLTTLAAAYAVSDALAVVDGRRASHDPLTTDAQLELRLADPLPRVLPARAHPVCGCGWGTSADTMTG
ncbi:MAG: hypothetical protein U0S36_02975 [Candidatus Nanopelagicales bacterium]